MILNSQTYNITEYHPVKKSGVPNPLFNTSIESKKLLDVKDHLNSKHKAGVQYFIGRMQSFFKKNQIDISKYDVAALVPSSQQGCYSKGLFSILNGVCPDNVKIIPNLLQRYRTIQSMHSGGMRAPEVHLSSILVNSHLMPKEAKILLLDDIITTEITMYSCRGLLEQAGAADVTCIALGRSV